MKRKMGLLTGLAVVVMVLVGCTTFKADGLAVMPMPDDMQVVGTFEDTVMVHKFLGFLEDQTYSTSHPMPLRVN